MSIFRQSHLLRWTALGTAFACLSAAAVIAAVLLRAPPRATVGPRLEAFDSTELWEPRTLPIRASQFRYAELNQALEEALDQLQSGRIDRALLSYSDALARWQDHPAALAGLARYYFALKDRGKLNRVLAELDRIEPIYPPRRLIQAELELGEGRVESARVILESLIEAGPPVQGRARLLLAAIALQQNRGAVARELVASVDESELELLDSRSAYARLQQAVGELQERAAQP